MSEYLEAPMISPRTVLLEEDHAGVCGFCGASGRLFILEAVEGVPKVFGWHVRNVCMSCAENRKRTLQDAALAVTGEKLRGSDE